MRLFKDYSNHKIEDFVIQFREDGEDDDDDEEPMTTDEFPSRFFTALK